MNGNSIQEWLNNEKTIAKSVKPYSHFDFKTILFQVGIIFLIPVKLRNTDSILLFIMNKNKLNFVRKKGRKLKSEIFIMQHILIVVFINTILFY